MKFFCSILVFSFLFTACSNLDLPSNYLPVQFELIMEINPYFKPDKCLYSSAHKTAYVLQKESNLIHLYRNGIRINTIGGMGFDRNQFSKLSDIALAPDGSLLALDMFAKKIKKFDQDGKFITEFALSDLSEPKLFDVSYSESFYIYDESRNEIIVSNYNSETESFQFGSFVLKKPASLIFSDNQIIINDRQNNLTLIFNNLGQKQAEAEGYYQLQRHQNFLLKPYYLEHVASGNRFCISTQKWSAFLQKNDLTIIWGSSKILIGKLRYEVR